MKPPTSLREELSSAIAWREAPARLREELSSAIAWREAADEPERGTEFRYHVAGSAGEAERGTEFRYRPTGSAGEPERGTEFLSYNPQHSLNQRPLWSLVACFQGFCQHYADVQMVVVITTVPYHLKN
ncbi:hypothetical protein [Alicyclobacillus ferrooxydans]|uniref:Uncharacterized protein n=1 Tax=Alicyclobacillus ferrooxydans TaxID=471514 RepID=A0A0P9CY50_9BACL|nr:hypothetical protein [Alicyclobacillus ferrooxydans]KPV41803.1 hypothetical protein AN477_20445 [Alicyclobacillus ferrooxydans]